MPRSDDAYDLVHTYDQAKAGKSKTARPAVRELGRDGAPVRLFIQEVRDPALVNTPPSGVRYVFVDQSGDLRRKNPDGSDELAVPTAPTDASYLTVNSEADLTGERQVTTSSRVSVTDNGPDSTAELDVVEGQIEAGNLAGSTGSAGQVLVTDGTDASFGAGPQNVPDWTEDENSPFTGSNQQEHTYTLSSTYDVVRVQFERFQNTSGADQAMDLRINGLTSVDYFAVLEGGTTLGPDDKIPLNDSTSFGPGNRLSGQLDLTGRASDSLGVAFNGPSEQFLDKALSVGSHRANTGTLSSITVRGRSGDTAVSARVYGLEI